MRYKFGNVKTRTQKKVQFKKQEFYKEKTIYT